MNKEEQKKLTKLALTNALKAKLGKLVSPMSTEEISKKTGIDIEELEELEKTALSKLKKVGIKKEHLETFGVDPDIIISRYDKGNSILNNKGVEDDNSNTWKNRLNNN
jgi:hypothetical protein